MLALKQIPFKKDSSEYAEILVEVFVDAVQKSSNEAAISGPEEITPALVECLEYVYIHGSSPIRKIAYGLNVSLSAASQLVERLVKKDLVTRRDNETDRRSAAVELTEEGCELIKKVRKRKSQWFKSIMQSMDKDDRRTFMEGLENFLNFALMKDDDLDRNCVKCGMKHVDFCVVNKVKSERISLDK